MTEIKKPFKGPGSGPVVCDGNGKPILKTMLQVRRWGEKHMRPSCTKVGVMDCGEYYRWSAC